MIHQQSGSAQFVTTTFRAELLKDADQHFGVVYRGKASQVKFNIIGSSGEWGWTWLVSHAIFQVMVVETEEAKLVRRDEEQLGRLRRERRFLEDCVEV